VTKKEELEGIRDAALRVALETLWDDVTKAGGKPGEFAKRAEEDGVALGGRKIKVRRARMTEELNVVQIKDRKTGKPYKAYKPDGNAFADIYQLPNGRWTAIVVQRFDANQPDFDPAKFRPHPAAKKIMRLHIDDMVALEDGGRRRILRVVKMSGQTITMADHLEGGALKARDADKNDIFKYVSKSASSLKDVGFRKVGVDEIGRLTDPGLRKPGAK
jgi:CRISPR-associated endonuclease Csn1